VRFVLVTPVVMLLCVLPGSSQGFEPHEPANERLRTTIREVTARQTVRPPAGLEQRFRAALRSINEVEGRTDTVAAAQLASSLRMAWQELERARAVSALGYREFDDERFGLAEAKLDAVTAQLGGPRAPLTAEGSRAVGEALSDVRALSRTARLVVPGLASDDVLLMRAKRQRAIAPRGGGEGQGAPGQNGTETEPPR